jgi:hypothetical protein
LGRVRACWSNTSRHNRSTASEKAPAGPGVHGEPARKRQQAREFMGRERAGFEGSARNGCGPFEAVARVEVARSLRTMLCKCVGGQLPLRASSDWTRKDRLTPMPVEACLPNRRPRRERFKHAADHPQDPSSFALSLFTLSPTHNGPRTTDHGPIAPTLPIVPKASVRADRLARWRT